jgi:hypothetical protein
MHDVVRLVQNAPVDVFRRKPTGGAWETGAARFSHYAGPKTVIEWPGGKLESLDHCDVRPAKESK